MDEDEEISLTLEEGVEENEEKKSQIHEKLDFIKF